MTLRTILICEAQVPFLEGGAESHVRQLAAQLRRRGFRAGIVSVPFKWYPRQEILAHAAAWRLLDLSESNGQPIDLVVGTKFPSYFARHPNKVTWLIHQYRPAYELCGTAFSDFDFTEGDVGLRQRIIQLDKQMLLESKRIFTNAGNTARRLEKYLGIQGEPLYHPPPLSDRLRPGPFGDYFLSVGRLDTLKRVDLAIQALALVPPPARLVIVGDGNQRAALGHAADQSGVADRVAFAGIVDDDRLIDLYSGARAIVFAPFDEDYGYVTLEAFLSAKPVITARDAGGPLEFVADGVTGRVCDPVPAALAEAMAQLMSNPRLASELGAGALERGRLVTWDGVIEKLIGAV